MSEVRTTANGGFAFFEDMTWPCPGKRMGDLEWTLRYGTPTREDLLYAASIVASFGQMVANDTVKRRNKNITQLRLAMRQHFNG